MTIAGVSGTLISGAYLEKAIAVDGGPAPHTVALANAVRRAAAACGPAASIRTLVDSGAAPVLAALGFDRIHDVRDHPAGATATLTGAAGSVALVVSRFGARLDPLWRAGVVAARERGAEWALIYNGTALRLVDATTVHLRRALDFDLDASWTPDALAALSLTVAAARLCARGAQSTRHIVAESDAHASSVCRSLRDGVLAASADVLDALIDDRRRHRATMSLPDSFEQALTIVYRLLFLLFAEARALVPLWHPVYRESYSVDALRAAAERSGGAPGLWDAVRAMTRLAHAGCDAGDLRVTPFNGRLFAPSRTPLAERRGLDDESARRAVLALSTRASATESVRERITYRDLGVEQLGAVYETLLDYEPHATSAGVTLVPESGARKSTGTFYTPQSIADYLVRRTLAPLVQGRTPERILALRIVDPSMGSGACLVAACRYLAEAYEAALVSAGECLPHEIDDDERALMRRRVAERCLYGVDLNPMAVQLARLSLWLATLAADRPLSFLDHRLMTGNSLIGAWLPQLRRPPRPRRTAATSAVPTLFDEEAILDAVRNALPVRFSLESTPNDTVDQVRAKEQAHAAAMRRDAALGRWKRVANAWCASWFSASVPRHAFTAVTDTVLRGSGALPRAAADGYVAAADDVARDHGFFHWELECPEVFFDASGGRLANPGFDAVIGNPPWNIVPADDGAFLRFARDSGAYHVVGRGHANRYQLFVERAIALTRAGGRIGLVLPWGFAADHGSAALRRFAFSRADVDALVAIDNHRGVFPIHRSVRFVLVSATAGAPTRSVACAFGIDDPSALDAGEDAGAVAMQGVRLSPATLERLSGNALAVPYVRTATDLAIAERAAALFAPLGAAEGWHVRFGRELNATDDRALFRRSGGGYPVIDGKHLAPFRVAVADAERRIAAADARRVVPGSGRARLGYRDVASATNRVTLIAAVLPPRCVSTHTVFCLRTPLPAPAQRFLCGLFNSLVVNFLVRLRVTTHVTTAIVEQLPIPPWSAAPGAAADVAMLARLLARRHSVEAFARLNALAAALYQLTRDEFARVLETFPLVDRAERDRAMELFVETPACR